MADPSASTPGDTSVQGMFGIGCCQFLSGEISLEHIANRKDDCVRFLEKRSLELLCFTYSSSPERAQEFNRVLEDDLDRILLDAHKQLAIYRLYGEEGGSTFSKTRLRQLETITREAEQCYERFEAAKRNNPNPSITAIVPIFGTDDLENRVRQSLAEQENVNKAFSNLMDNCKRLLESSEQMQVATFTGVCVRDKVAEDLHAACLSQAASEFTVEGWLRKIKECQATMQTIRTEALTFFRQKESTPELSCLDLPDNVELRPFDLNDLSRLELTVRAPEGIWRDIPVRFECVIPEGYPHERLRVRCLSAFLFSGKMGNTQGDLNQNQENKNGNNDGTPREKPPPPVFGKNKKKQQRNFAPIRIPTVTPSTKCRLRLLKLERIKDYLLLEEEYVANKIRLNPTKNKNQDDLVRLEDLRGSPMSVGTMEEMIDDNHAIVTSSMGPEYYVNILSFVDKTLLEPGCSVLLHNKTNSVVGILLDDVDPLVSLMKVERAPLESYSDIGGLEEQIQEIKEAVELPLTHPELYEEVGIRPPKGVILYGPPGTGKTLLAKAVANETCATFLRVVGSELIQKYLGEGPKLVREMFRVAEENAPSIIFIDEIDAIGTKRYDATSGGEKEIQRTMLELLNQLDGFDPQADVKVIMATNRIESLDPALIRPGRIDRKIQLPNPDTKTKRKIFEIHTSKMTMAQDVDLEEFVNTKDDLSGADIKAICTEAGLLALRERRMQITQADLRKAREKALQLKKGNIPESLYC
ncbi:26S proteasome regulatory subunit 4 -like protein B [Babesia sp. Xinjiang]|uniref:26S proteasome regulatory subunit 4 -like protein B n=1 Tax=Babesia sp. Xinjiang TaxID=462227 RepID=UPI000A2487D0|nr:26S proteasome regulatory subunit 4 -like protein B [Babesia sp. Xinjiang]ORM39351.1 26S proteasome regulatory subunit 4 -like protein B [Babesia sp. Xinjiang]